MKAIVYISIFFSIATSLAQRLPNGEFRLKNEDPSYKNNALGKTTVYDLSSYVRFSDSTAQKIDQFFSTRHLWGIFNGTFLFYKNDSLISGNYGYANFPQRDTLYDDDLFQLASVSKTVTGIAIMLCHQDGLLHIDDSVHFYLRDLQRKNLTIRNLLTHTSGLPDYFYYSSALWPYPHLHMTNSDVVRQVNAQPWRNFGEPGTYHSYSNTNYVLLAHIVEHVTGMNFRDFVSKNIFEPSGMKYSHICNFDSIAFQSYVVQGYEGSRSLYKDIPHNGTTGDKGVYSNTFEMFFLDRALRNSYLLHRYTKEEMWRPHVVTNADGGYYALGWRVKWIDGQKWVFHNGWWKGFRTYYWRCLDEDKMFVVLTNNVQGPFLKTAEMVSLLK